MIMNSTKVFAILTFTLFLISCGQNKLNGSDCFLLIKDKGTISLNIYENDKIKEIRVYDKIPIKGILVSTNNFCNHL